MAATPQSIIEAIDTAVLNWVGRPVTLSIDGYSRTFHSLESLTAARDYYARQLAAGSLIRNGFKLANIKSGGTR